MQLARRAAVHPHLRIPSLASCWLLSCSCVNSTDSEDGCTPLHLACRKGDMECLLELLECHARLDITDRNGETAFHYAVRGNNPQIIEVGAISKLGVVAGLE